MEVNQIDWRLIVTTQPDRLIDEVAIILNTERETIAGEEWEIDLPLTSVGGSIRNLILFTVKFGFTSAEVDDAIRLHLDVYSNLVYPGNEQAIESDVEIFIECCRRYVNLFNSVKFEQLIRYINEDIMQHKNLYKFSALYARNDASVDVNLTVDTFSQDLIPLRNGQKREIREYELKLKEIEIQESIEKAKLLEKHLATEVQREQAFGNVDRKMEDVRSVDPASYKNVAEIIRRVVQESKHLVEINISNLIDDVEFDLTYKLMKTSLPRPVKLGMFHQHRLVIYYKK